MRFESKLRCDRRRAWEWITSLDGVAAEMRPFLRMTAPKNVRTLADVDVTPGKLLFRSRVFLFGVIPIDHSDLTVLELRRDHGFVEQSPMGSMRLWRHERQILDCASDETAVVVEDRLTFEPRWAKPLVGWFIKRVFAHRHRVLRKQLGDRGASELVGR
jgi:hypothetical protein